MRILHIIPSYKPAYIYGGVIESVSRLCEGLAEAGHQVDVYTTTANGKTELMVRSDRTVSVDGVRVKYFRRITKDPTHVSPALWLSLFRTCGDYDIIHIHSWWNFLVVVAAVICQWRKKKVIISPRGMLSDYIFSSSHGQGKRWFHRLVGRTVLSKSVFHATAESEYEECRRLIGGWKGFHLPNILMLPECDIRKRENKVFTLVFLSRIHPKKGLELLFQAMRDLPFEWRLRIAGSGEASYMTRLAQLANDLGIGPKIEWLGWMERRVKFDELMRGDVFVLTSYNENFANVVIEALHVGTTVLVSEQVGLAAFVRENALGWVTALDTSSIRNALIEAYSDSARRETVARSGREVVDKYFSQSALIRQYIRSYNMILHDRVNILARNTEVI